jgi:hypothetical protein
VNIHAQFRLFPSTGRQINTTGRIKSSIFCLMEPTMYLDNKCFSAPVPNQGDCARGFRPLYHDDTVNHCPGCGRTHWLIGRVMAECAFCETALPLAVSVAQPAEPLFWFRGSNTAATAV